MTEPIGVKRSELPSDPNAILDLPHQIDALLSDHTSEAAIPWCSADRGASEYVFSDPSPEESALFAAHAATVCGPPLWIRTRDGSFSPNSGAHRVLLDLTYRGERLAIAIEEREDMRCGWAGEMLFVGAETPYGRNLIEAGGTALVVQLIRGFILATTGQSIRVDLTRPTFRFRGDTMISEFTDRFKLHIMSREEVLEQGCTLSESAQDCPVFFLKRLFKNLFD